MEIFHNYNTLDTIHINDTEHTISEFENNSGSDLFSLSNNDVIDTSNHYYDTETDANSDSDHSKIYINKIYINKIYTDIDDNTSILSALSDIVVRILRAFSFY